LHDEGSSESDTLSLTSTELMGVAIQKVEEPQGLQDLLLELGRDAPLTQSSREKDIAPYPLPREKPILLRYKSYLMRPWADG